MDTSKKKYDGIIQKYVWSSIKQHVGRGKPHSVESLMWDIKATGASADESYLRRLKAGKLSDQTVQLFVDWLTFNIDPSFQEQIELAASDCSSPLDRFFKLESGCNFAITTVKVFDNILDKKNRERTERLLTIRNRANVVLSKIPATAFAEDSLAHAITTTQNVAFLFSDVIEQDLSDYECFVLGVASYIHDIGMTSSSNGEPKSQHQRHCHESEKFAFKLVSEGYLDETEAQDIASLCSVHNQPCDNAKIAFKLNSTGKARLNLLFAMFWLSDTLDFKTHPDELFDIDIDPELMRQAISDVELKVADKIITVTKARNGSLEAFQIWMDLLNRRMIDLNRELKVYGADYRLRSNESISSVLH